MKVFTRFANKKRAVSPVIAVILLIGLAVAAVAIIFVVVIPMLQPTRNLQMDDAYIEYDDATTKAGDVGEGYGKGTLLLSNAGTGDIKISSLRVYYASSFMETSWTEINNHDKLAITEANPYILKTLTILDELTVGFPIPEENDNNTISYRITITTSDGAEYDTSTEADVADTDMQLSKDRPDINFLGTSLDNLRRIESEKIRPSQIDDNSEIKNVIYRVYRDTDGKSVKNKTIEPPSSLWTWVWDTRNDSSEGLDNGTYYMTMTVYDYAGLSEKTKPIYFTIDNDYTPPTINYVAPEADWAEVGDDFKIVANVVDTGCGDSQVEDVWLHYKLLNETSYRQPIRMDPLIGDNYSDSIPIDAQALEFNLTYYIEAIDLDDNKENDSIPILEANDTVYPNIFHTPVLDADEYGDVLINAQVEDPGLVDLSKVFLFARKSNDLDASATVAGEPLPSSWVSIDPTTIEALDDTTWNFIWSIPQPYYNVTIHGVDYYINATDKYGGNTAQHGAHHIDVLDLDPPDFVGVSSSIFPDSWTSGTDYPINVQINDNDQTFGRVVNGDMNTFVTGKVTIHFKKWDGNPSQIFSPGDINQTVHLSGNSSKGEITAWYGIIPSQTFVNDPNHRVDFYITAEDQSKATQDQHSIIPTRWPESGFYSIDVKAPGEPNVIYSEYSVGLKNNNETVFFMINNTASGDPTPAHATLTDMYLEIFSDDWDFSNGEPNLTKVVFTRYTSSDSYNDTGGSPHPWGGNGTWIAFDSSPNQGRVEDDNDYNIIELTFSNTSGGFIDMHNMVLNVSFKAKVGANPVDDQWIGLIATPGVEPEFDLETPFLYSGRNYINHWLVTPLYSDNGYTGISWDTDIRDPWSLDYSRSDVATGIVKPYHGFNTPNGASPVIGQPNGQWSRIANNELRQERSIVNIDDLYSGGARDSYVWFSIIILVDDPSAQVSAQMWLGSDDEAVCYINHADSYAGFYGSPRGYAESVFSVTLNGQNLNNYILFGVHEVGGGYRGSLAFDIDFEVKVYTAPPPPPLGSPIQSIGIQNSVTALRTSEPSILTSIQSIQLVPVINEFKKLCCLLKR